MDESGVNTRKLKKAPGTQVWQVLLHLLPSRRTKGVVELGRLHWTYNYSIKPSFPTSTRTQLTLRRTQLMLSRCYLKSGLSCSIKEFRCSYTFDKAHWCGNDFRLTAIELDDEPSKKSPIAASKSSGWYLMYLSGCLPVSRNWPYRPTKAR